MRVPAGQESSKNQPKLGVDKPAHPCTWQGPAGASHAPPSVPPKVPRHQGRGRLTTAWKGDGIGSRNFLTSCHPGSVPAVGI